LKLIAEDTGVEDSLTALHIKNSAIAELVTQSPAEPSDETAGETAVNVSKDLVILSEWNRVDGDSFYEPRSGILFKINPVTLQTTPLEQNTDRPLVGDGLWDLFQAYADKTLNKKASALGLYQVDEETVAAVLVGSRVEAKNMWNGQWKTVWTYCRGTNRLAGRLEAFVHYYEEGNIQLKASKSVQFELDAADSDDTMLKKIEEAENAFQLALAEAYQQLNQSAFKRLRRQLPVTRTKMDWSKIGAYSLGSELRHVAN
jgi:capping protein alpha